MKIFSFSRTVVLFAVVIAPQSAAIPRDGKLGSCAIAYTDVYDHPFRTVEEVDCLLKRSDDAAANCTRPVAAPPMALCL